MSLIPDTLEKIPFAGKYLAKVYNIFTPFSTSASRAAVMCDNNESGPFNDEMLARAEAEDNSPIFDLLKDTYQNIKDAAALPFNVGSRLIDATIARPAKVAVNFLSIGGNEEANIAQALADTRDDIRDTILTALEVAYRSVETVAMTPVAIASSVVNRVKYVMDGFTRFPPRLALVIADYATAGYGLISSKIMRPGRELISSSVNTVREGVRNGLTSLLNTFTPFIPDGTPPDFSPGR